jgi:DNA repair photolyase
VGSRGLTSLFENICGDMWSVTPYAMCDHRCVYCCTWAQGPSDPILPVDEARAVARAFVADSPEGRVFLLGAFSDGYPNVEEELQLTRVVLEELVRGSGPLTIITKGEAVLRDLDLLVEAGERAQVQISLCSLDEAALRRLDLGAPSAATRLDMVRTVRAAGVRVGVNALPWIPDVTDTRALIETVEPDVEIIFSPLAFGEGRDSMHLLGRELRRDEVWRRYNAEYERFGHVPNTSWVRPSAPPQENHPLYRLPTIDSGVPVEVRIPMELSSQGCRL